MNVVCKRCGEMMDIKQRCCLKCGALNPENPNNYNVLGMENNEILTIDESNNNFTGVSKVLFIVINSVLFLFGIIGVLLLNSIPRVSINVLSIFVFLLILSLESISIQILFIKSNLPWWGYFIPFYGIYLFYVLAFGDKKLVLKLFIISIVGSISIRLLYTFITVVLASNGTWFKYISAAITSIFSLSIGILSLLNLGRRFNMSRILVLLFPAIAIPIMAFSNKYQIGSEES